jgi:ribose/xylose/arabinose/galactoside ABC-type transport system permease subunit
MIQARRLLKNTSGMTWAVWILIALFIFFAPGFATFRNVQNILRNSSVLVILSCGMTLTIVSRQLDLSVGGVATFAGMMAAFYIRHFENPGIVPIFITLLIGIVAGAALGAFNGMMIGKFRYNYWLITFATMSIAFAFSQVLTSGNIISGFSKNFRDIANVDVFGIPGIVWFAAAVVIVLGLVSGKTRFGIYVFGVGDSEQCVKLSGINVSRIRFVIYLISGALAGLGGVLLAARTNSASPISGVGYEFDAVAAVVVGGTPMDGGRGGIFGTVYGALVISAIKVGLQLVGFSIFVQQVLIGLIILSIIVADVQQELHRQRRQARRIYK